MLKNIKKIADLFEYISLLIVFILLLVFAGLVIFYMNLSHFDVVYASIVPIAMMLIGFFLIYDDIKRREKAKKAIKEKVMKSFAETNTQ